MKFQGYFLRSKKEFRDPRGHFDIPEELSEISRTVLRYYRGLSDLRKVIWDFREGSKISGSLPRSQIGILRSEGVVVRFQRDI